MLVRGTYFRYTKALESDSEDEFYLHCIFYCNRALCRWKLSDNAEAINDCSRSLEANPRYLKALLKRHQLFNEYRHLKSS